jgi:DNA-binding response OmpR family regulator
VISFPKYQSYKILKIAKTITTKKQVLIRFLLIDDEANILRAVKLFFADTEVDLNTARSAKEGKAAIEADRFDVVLCDLSMDDMNGLEVGKSVGEYCSRQEMPKMPFLLYTGMDQQLNAIKLKEAGIDRVIYKATACQELLRIIREMAARRKSISLD